MGCLCPLPAAAQEEVAAFEQQYRASPAASGPTKWPRFSGGACSASAPLHGCLYGWLGLEARARAPPHLEKPHLLPPLPLPACLPACPIASEFMRDAFGGAMRDVNARQDERRKAEAAAAAQAAEVARLQAQAAEQRLASAESEGSRLQARLGEAERRLGEVTAELAREREKGAAAAAQLARLEQQVAHLEQSKAAESRSLSQQAEAALRAAQAGHQAEVAQLSAASAEAARRAAEAQQQLAAAQAELTALRQQAAATGAAAQDVQGRLAALAAERDGLNDTLQVQGQGGGMAGWRGGLPAGKAGGQHFRPLAWHVAAVAVPTLHLPCACHSDWMRGVCA